jgi:hypothetical protein
MLRRLGACLAVAAVLAMSACAAVAAGPSVTSRAGAFSTVTPASGQSPTSTANLGELRTDDARLQQRVSDLTGNLTLYLTIIAAVVALLGFLLVIGAYRADQRASASFSLAIEGERAAQGRATQSHGLFMTTQARANEIQETFVQGSEKTLNLVNQTLELAAQASQRAAQALETRSRRNLEALDQRAKQLFSEILTGGDRVFTDDVHLRYDVLALGDDVRGFEISTDYLLDDLDPTPHCLFFRGMELHLRQQFEEALERWTRVVHHDVSEPLLRSAAWYWIGYEQNNLGAFSHAETAFANAVPGADGARLYEIQRIQFESRFFGQPKVSESEVLVPLERLLERVRDDDSDGIARTRAKIAATLGNVRHELGVGKLDEDDCDGAANYFRGAETLFSSLHDDKWAPFGLAEAVWRLAVISGDTAERQRAEDEYVDQVMPRAREENVRRIEPRSKVLALTTQLVCAVRAPRLRRQALTAYEGALQALGQVDERMTVYSQFCRRNVPKRTFELEVQAFWARAEEEGLVVAETS